MSKRIPNKQWKQMSVEEQKKVIATRKGGKAVAAPVKTAAAPAKSRKRARGRKQVQDARTASADPGLRLTNQVGNVNIEIGLNLTTLQGVCHSFASQSLQNGFAAFSSDPNDTLGAANIMYQMFLNAAAGAEQSIQSAPLWMVEFCKCIASKGVKLGLGMVTYKLTNVVADSSFPITSPIGPPSYSYEYTYLQPGGDMVDLFPTAIPMTLPSDGGMAAWQRMVTFLQSLQQPQNAIALFSAKIGAAENSVSVFANCFSSQGGGFGGNGGYQCIIGQEVPTFEPILALLANGDVSDGQTQQGQFEANRWPNYPRTFAGDALLASQVMSNYPIAWWQMKKPSRLHSVDFLEFGDVIAQWLGAAVTLYGTDPVNINLSSSPTVFLTCPLTLQEVLLLLRNEIISLFKASQYGVQGLYPVNSVGDSDNQFIAYQSTATTCPIQTAGMLLPQSLVENVRALVARSTYEGGKKPADHVCYLPVLGQYALDRLLPSDYGFSYIPALDAAEESSLLFTAEPVVRKRVVTKTGAEAWEAVVEAPIDLVDGYCATFGSYVYINDTTRLAGLSALWNDYIQRFSKYMDPLVNISTEIGPGGLCSVSCTRFWQPFSPTYMKKAEKYRDARAEVVNGKKRSGRNSPYSQRQAIGDSSQGEFYGPTYEQIMSTWILPTALVTVGSNYNNVQTITRVQAFESETHLKNTSATGQNAITISDLHARYATKMTRSSTAIENDWISAFKELDVRAQGGFLSSLIAGVGNIINEVLPF